MPILNYTTKVHPHQTIAEIQKILVAHGATKIIIDYDGTIPRAVSFGLKFKKELLHFVLPCNYAGVWKAMKDNHDVKFRYRTEEHAVWIAWRIIKDWVEAQMAFIDAEQASLVQVFLPYAVTKSGETLFNVIDNGDSTFLLTS